MKQMRIAECKCNSLSPYSGKETNGKIEYKETMKNLLNEADWVGIGSRKHGEKDVVELEFWFELAEKLKK